MFVYAAAVPIVGKVGVAQRDLPNWPQDHSACSKVQYMVSNRLYGFFQVTCKVSMY